MKQIQFEIEVNEKTGKIKTFWKTRGYSKSNIKHQLELLGLMENTKRVVGNRQQYKPNSLN